MAVPKRLRYEILRRDNHTCQYCGATTPGARLTIDHVIPEVLGGKTEPNNLVTACEPCNLGKASSTPDAPVVEGVNQSALVWVQAMEIAAKGQHAEREERDAIRAAFLATWKGWKNGQGESPPMPLDWPSTVDTFIKAGLTVEDLDDAVDTAMRRSTVQFESVYKYFCGVCWRTLDDRREMAAQLVRIIESTEVGEG